MAKDYNTIRFLNETSETAVIEIYGTIGGFDWKEWKEKNTIEQMAKELNRLKELKTKNIEVRICSYGGYVDHALAIHDALKDHPAKITTVVNSYCASSATIIAQAGDVRKISKNALYLIHKCSSYIRGNEHDLEMELESQRTTNETIYNIYKEHCTKTETELKELFNYNNGNGKWLSVQEVLDFGFADEIYNENSSAKAASIDRRMLNRFCLPEIPEGYEIEEKFNFKDFAEKFKAEIIEFIKPTHQNINQNQTEMNKFSAKFACLALLLTAIADSDYDPEKGQLLTDEQLQDLDKNLNEFKTLKENFSKLEDEKKKADETIAEQKTTIENLTQERDSYKTKYENAPGKPAPIAGIDPSQSSFEETIENDEYYKEINKTLKQF